MRIQPRGPEGIASRMREIEAKLDAQFGRPVRSSNFNEIRVSNSQPETLPGVLQGPISPSGAMPPLSPFAPGVKVSQSNPARDQLRPLIANAAVQAGIDPNLLEALVEAESDFRPNLVSPKNAMGLTQLMPETARSLGVADPFDPEQNLLGGAKYLSQMLRQFGDPRLALAAYNAGPGAVRRHGGVPPFAETSKYVNKVLARYQELS